MKRARGKADALAALVLLAAVGCGGQSAHEGFANRAGFGGDAGTSGTSGAGGTATAGAGAGGTGTADAGTGGIAASAGTGLVEPPEPEPLLNLSALAQGQSGYVAVGRKWSSDFETSTGVIFHSNDGRSWSKVASELPIALLSVAYGNDRFVTFGSAAQTTGAYVSDDGVHWDAGNNPTSYRDLGFAFGNGLFVAQGNGTLYTSADGLAWADTGEAVNWANVAFASGHFVVATAPDGSLYGTGKTWEPLTIIDELVNGITVRGYGDHFLGDASNVCCFGEQPSTNKYYRLSSTDGKTWTTERVSAPASLPVLDNGTLCITADSGHISTGPDCDHLEPVATIPHYASAALKADDGYLVAGDGGIFASPDGTTWTQVLSDP